MPDVLNAGRGNFVKATLVFFLGACFLYGIWPAVNAYPTYQGQLNQLDWNDQTSIINAIDASDSPWKWWNGPWVLTPRLDFYRPLTSAGFWWLYHTSGGNLAVFMACHWGLHLLVTAGLVLFIQKLFRSTTLALVTGSLWAGRLAYFVTLPNLESALFYWRDLVETSVAALVFGFLGCVLGWLRTNSRWYYGGAVAFLSLAVLMKETAYMLPLLAAVLVWKEDWTDARRGRQSRWVHLLPFLFLVVVVLVWRFYVLDGMGSRIGTNHSWFARAAVAWGGGRPMVNAFAGNMVSFVLALWLLSTLCLFKGKRGLTLLCLFTGVTLAFVGDYRTASPWGDTFLRMVPGAMSSMVLPDTLLTLFLGAMWTWFFINRETAQILALLFFGVLYVPLFTLPATLGHHFYLPSVAWALWLAVPITRLIEGYIVRGTPGERSSAQFALSKSNL